MSTAASDRLVSLPTDDLSELIKIHEEAAMKKNHRSLAAVFTLKNYKMWLEDPKRPTYINLIVKTLDNDWRDDGLFYYEVNKIHFVNKCKTN